MAQRVDYKPGPYGKTQSQTKPCYQDKPIAQTLFLGASVSSFNVSKGWSGQPSQLTVNLIEDDTPTQCLPNERQYPVRSASGPDYDEYNHYHDCNSPENCYITSSGTAVQTDTPLDDRYVPGKVYYEYQNTINGNAMLSKYWYDSDPGFFGVRNRTKKDGNHISPYDDSTTSYNKPYDIIGTPVYFKMGELTFGGVVQSWNRTLNSGGKGFSVIVNGMESILSNCYVILSDFAGSIYSAKSGGLNLLGGPRNYAGKEGVKYWDSISNGNIPNVFNVYGFLESMNKGGFGGSRLNDDGIEANAILDALCSLTSADYADGLSIAAMFDPAHSNQPDYGPKSAFSPFGRIIVKCMQVQDTYEFITPDFNKFGVIPPTPLQASSNNGYYCQFLLDLSELPILPKEYRISGQVLSILDIITQITEESGYDYHISTYPIAKDSKSYNVIKVHTISRAVQPRPNAVSNTIKSLQCSGYPVSSITNGQEQNETQAKLLLVGGKQQRLYQAKSLRMAYSQSTFILNPYNFEFVDYRFLGWNDAKQRREGSLKFYAHGKIKIPSMLSNRNIEISKYVNPSYSNIYDHDQDIINRVNGSTWNTIDLDWNDDNQLNSGQDNHITGNYKKSILLKEADSTGRTPLGPIADNRFFPLYLDVICPFFGFLQDEEYKLDPSAENNDFRRIRPVFLDTWTGQLVVVLNISELPIINVPLSGFYGLGQQLFTLTENEIRAAIAGFDNFLVYCLAKTYKNDIIEMVRRAYLEKYTRAYSAAGASNPAELAAEKTDWYWRLIGGNIAGPYDQTIGAGPDKGDGSASIEEEVMQDLRILHKFVAQVGQYYGKKYMVTAPSLRAYKDEQYADMALPTSAGTAFVFNGGGKLYFNYQPTNDGAWEEYGNIIDDSIAVGSDDWYNLTDDSGKIKPILAYNANEFFDYIRYSICIMSQTNLDRYTQNAENDPFWNFDAYNYIQSLRDGSCNNSKFLFSGLDLSSLNSTDYILKDIEKLTYSQNLTLLTGIEYRNIRYERSSTKPRDAWSHPTESLNMKKLYMNTTVSESFVFLDPLTLSHPKIIIDAPGIPLNSTSEQIAKDPNRTVISNVAVEDLSLYMHSVNKEQWDSEWINYMKYYIGDVHSDSSIVNGDMDMIGSFAASANQSANFVEIAPKVAHPLFVGIPIKHNQSTYGPWTNYPYLNADKIFKNGSEVVQSQSLPVTCAQNPVIIDAAAAKRAVDNWILPTKVEINSDLVPWNYGGMALLDKVAYNLIEQNLNYQSIIETAQIDIVGLPLFGLGMGFNVDAITPAVSSYSSDIISYNDVKDNSDDAVAGPILDYSSGYNLGTRNSVTVPLKYKIVRVNASRPYTDGPIITNIQTSVGQNGVTTTYTFRTYTPKIGLFNRQNIDRIKKANLDNLKRGKQLAKIGQQSQNNVDVQSRFMQEQKFQNSTLGGEDYASRLFGWSPSTVLIGQSQPYIRYPDRETPYEEPYSLFSAATSLDTINVPNPNTNPYVFRNGRDRGLTGVITTDRLRGDLPNVVLSDSLRHKTTVGMYEAKEVEAQLKKNRGLQSVMSLDGILSPVSFYPTLKNSTFSYGLYDTDSCPFCHGTKIIKTNYAFRMFTGQTIKEREVQIYCNKCGSKDKNSGPASNQFVSLKGTVTTSAGKSVEVLPPYIISSGTDIDILLQFRSLASTSSSSTNSSLSSGGTAGVKIPINLVTLNPIVVPYGNVTNTNIQNYTGVHPDGSGVHEDLSFGIYSSTYPRYFHDRCRHSIEIVGRGSVKPKQLSIHNNLTTIRSDHQVDFYEKDLVLQDKVAQLGGGSVNYQMNQRFLGLRGPLVMHGWGYDLEGYPVPNAADEPYEIDKYGRPRRFKLKLEGDKYVNDLENSGGFFDPTMTANNLTSGYRGDIISKTQKWLVNGQTNYSNPGIGQTGGKWNAKKKLKEFYLNWAERPDLWPVGPIDLRWDADRRVWTTKSSDVTLYKMVYVTLEEDLINVPGSDTTFPARGFLDDLEYATEPLSSGYRRVVYVKDRTSYTAPRGVKLLCRFDKESGFYEPVGKPNFMAKGSIIRGTNTANLEMSYAAGARQGGGFATILITFDNPFGLKTSGNGLFTYINGTWTLTASA